MEEERIFEREQEEPIQKEEAIGEIGKGVSVTEPQVMEIKRLETKEPLYSFELRNVQLKDLFRVMAHDYKLNILVDADVQGTITASFSNISLERALEAIAESQNLILKKQENLIRVSRNFITRAFKLKHMEAKKLLEKGYAANVLDLLSKEGKALLGPQPNSILVIDYPSNVERIETFLQMADERMDARVFKLKYLSASELVGKKKKEGQEGAVAQEEAGPEEAVVAEEGIAE